MSTGIPDYGASQNNGNGNTGQGYGDGTPQTGASQPYDHTYMPPAKPGIAVGDGLSWS